jgi:hypothetical protein
MARLALIVAALMSFAGCVSSRAFMPTEHVTGFSPRGDYYAAEYPIVERGQTVADVKLWSAGAIRDASDAEPRTTVRVAVELDNHGDAPLRLDPKQLYLEEIPKPGATPGRTTPARIEGETLVQPGQTRKVDVAFDLPRSVWPSDVPGFRVAWSVVGERVHSRKTPFLRALEVGRTDPWSPYYSPYYGWYYPGLYSGYPFYGSWPYLYRTWPSPWRGPRIYYVPR